MKTNFVAKNVFAHGLLSCSLAARANMTWLFLFFVELLQLFVERVTICWCTYREAGRVHMCIHTLYVLSIFRSNGIIYDGGKLFVIPADPGSGGWILVEEATGTRVKQW